MKAIRYITIFLSMLIALFSSAQDNSTIDFKRFQIGINFSPDLSYRTLENNDGSSLSDMIIAMRNENETVKIGYATGINVCFNIKKFFGVEMGIQYSNKGYQTLMQDLFFPSDENTPSKAKIIYNNHYVDIPVKANFTIGKKKVRFFTSIGLTTNFFIKETSTSILFYPDYTDRKTNPTDSEYNKINLSPTISAGIDYKISNRMNLRVEPTFRYGILKISDTPVTGYWYNVGLNIGYYF